MAFLHPISPLFPAALQHLLSHTRGIYSFTFSPTAGEPSLAADQQYNWMLRIPRSDATPEELEGFTQMMNALLMQRETNPRALDHPHIYSFTTTQLLDNISGELIPALVTRWYSNEDILSFCTRNAHIPRIPLLVQAARAVEHLHIHGVTHGNIHAKNMLISDDERVIVTDISVYTQASRCILFPHARTLSDPPSSVYQAPEWHNHENFTPPAMSTDVYAFASVIFAVCTLDPIFSASRIGHVSRKTWDLMRNGHLRCISKPSSELLPDALWNVIQWCWATDPAERPTMREVVATLELSLA